MCVYLNFPLKAFKVCSCTHARRTQWWWEAVRSRSELIVVRFQRLHRSSVTNCNKRGIVWSGGGLRGVVCAVWTHHMPARGQMVSLGKGKPGLAPHGALPGTCQHKLQRRGPCGLDPRPALTNCTLNLPACLPARYYCLPENNRADCQGLMANGRIVFMETMDFPHTGEKNGALSCYSFLLYKRYAIVMYEIQNSLSVGRYTYFEPSKVHKCKISFHSFFFPPKIYILLVFY